MRWMKWVSAPLLGAVVMASSAVASEKRIAPAAFLYSYTLKDPGAFAAGYKEHLRWHRDAHDKLAWYGWRVTSGDRIGQFVDGTFGNTLADIDARVTPKLDGANFVRTTSPHVTASGQQVLELLPQLSGTFTLEDRQPSASIDVYFVSIRPGAGAAFETAVAQHRQAMPGSAGATWYRAVLGGQLPSYIVMVPRSSWQDLKAAGHDFAPWLASLGAGSGPGAPLITSVRSEVWDYDADLSYIPAS